MKQLFAFAVFSIFSIAASSTTLECSGVLRTNNPNPYVPNPYGFNGQRAIDSILIQIKERLAPQCGYESKWNCGTVLISGNEFLNGDYLISFATSAKVGISKKSGKIDWIGYINRFTGEVALYRQDKIDNQINSLFFDGSCRAKAQLF